MFSKLKADELERHGMFVRDVVKQNGVPVVLAPYGVKKQVIDGETYLVAMLPEERNALLESKGIGPAGICLYNGLSGGCHLQDCSGCGYTDDDNAASCYCSD